MTGQRGQPAKPLKPLPQTWLKKSELEVGEYYIGVCRNARIARWDGKVFHHWRQKFGSIFVEQISHPEDEPYFDVFQPIAHCPTFQVREVPLE